MCAHACVFAGFQLEVMLLQCVVFSVYVLRYMCVLVLCVFHVCV